MLKIQLELDFILSPVEEVYLEVNLININIAHHMVLNFEEIPSYVDVLQLLE